MKIQITFRLKRIMEGIMTMMKSNFMWDKLFFAGWEYV